MLTSIRSASAPSPSRTSVNSDKARSSRDRVVRADGVKRIWRIALTPVLGCLAANASGAAKPRNAPVFEVFCDAPDRRRRARRLQKAGDGPLVLLYSDRCLQRHQVRPKGLPYAGRQHVFEVFQGSPPQLCVAGGQAAKRDVDRLPGKDQREEGEDVRQALTRPIAHEFVK